jgi:hypothetical protein
MSHQHSRFVPDIAGPSIHATGQATGPGPETCRLPSFEDTINQVEDEMVYPYTRPLDPVPADPQDSDPGFGRTRDRSEDDDWLDADYKPPRNWR